MAQQESPKVRFRNSKTVAQATEATYVTGNQGVIHFTTDASKTGDELKFAQRIILNGTDYSGVKLVKQGSADGTISVDGTDVYVKGLGSAAYANATDFLGKAALSGYQPLLSESNKLSSSFVSGLGDAAGKGVTPSTSSSADNSNVPTMGKVQELINSAVAGASNYLGTITSKSSLSTTAKKGDFYRVSNAQASNWSGSPQDIHVGDILIAEKDNPTQTFFSESNQNGWSILHNEIVITNAYQLNCNEGLYGGASADGNVANVQDALNRLTTVIGNKLTKNTPITGATKCKITYDANGLVTSGADLTANDIPTLGSGKITVTSAKYGGKDDTTLLQTALNNLSTAVGNAAGAAAGAQSLAIDALTYLTWD